MAPKKHILVVDDDPDIVKIVKSILEGEGHSVSCAYNGLEALKRLEEKLPDALIIDRIMPGMDGLEVIWNLKQSPESASLPVIMLTSMDKMDDVSEGYQKGADCYITKPFTKAQVLNGLHLAMASRPKLSTETVEAHAVPFLRACQKLSERTGRLVSLFAAEASLSPSSWLYRGLEARVKTDQVQEGSLRADPAWRCWFRGWGVEFQNSKTGEQVDLAIGPGGRSDCFDEWRVQCFIDNEAQRRSDFKELSDVIKNHSDAAKTLMNYLSQKHWIETARAKGEGKKDYDAQLGDRWVVSNEGAKILAKSR